MEGTLTTAFAVVAAAAAVCTCGRQTALFSSWIIRRLESPPRSLPPSLPRSAGGREGAELSATRGRQFGPRLFKS